MAKVDTLQVNVWEAKFTPDDRLALTRFQISPAAQETLTQWSREKSGRNDNQPVSVVLRGLSEITGWFVPEVAFVRQDWDAALHRKRLSFCFTGDVAADACLRQRMKMALQLWVNTLYPDKPAEQRASIAASAQEDAGWALLDISCALDSGSGACPRARDTLYWDALAAHAARRLAGQPLRFASGESRVLIPRTAQASAYEGLELVAFPPKRGTEKGLWSEVIKLHTATFPERGVVHVLARPSIRNWGAVTRAASRQGPRRALDIFLPADEAFGHATRRHTSFAFQARRGPEGPDGTPAGIVGYWPHKDNQKVFDLLRRLTHQSALAPNELAAPIIDEDGLWVLPRLGTVHKDKYLPGGTGVAWPDRKDIGDSLHQALEGAGFARAAPLTRRTTQHKVQKTFDKDQSAARRAVCDALAANGGGSALIVYVFHVREATPERVVGLLVERFGEPEKKTDRMLEWADGLKIEVRSAAADALSEELPAPELTAEESAGRNDRQLKSMRDLKRDEARDAVIKRMAAHISSVRGDDIGLACGLLEMPKTLLDKPRQDPFQFARRELARHDILPQVVLVDTKSEVETKKPGTAGKADAPPKDTEKYAAAIRDCFRMLGALPLDLLPDALRPAALTIVQRNAEKFGLGSRESQAIPLAVRVRGTLLECATPDENGAPRWSPYARAALRIFQGDYGKFGRGKQAENIVRYHEFFATVLDDINRAGPALVIAEGETIRHKVEAFANAGLQFDRLTLNGTTLTPHALANVRLIRVSPDPDRQPFYYHEGDNKWVSGLFEWDGAQRTFYALKTKPISVSHSQSFASMTSRHGEEGSNVNVAQIDIDRVSSQVDEVCVMFLQPGDVPLDLATMTHRLRGAHVQTGVDTTSPFPLHELRLLAGGITF
jgi:hypothetical protein